MDVVFCVFLLKPIFFIKVYARIYKDVMKEHRDGFKMADTDGDGKVSLAEDMALWKLVDFNSKFDLETNQHAGSTLF